MDSPKFHPNNIDISLGKSLSVWESQNLGNLKYGKPRGVPTRVENGREIAKLAKTELVQKFRETGEIAKYAKSQTRVLTGGEKFDTKIFNLLCESDNSKKKMFFRKNIFLQKC